MPMVLMLTLTGLMQMLMLTDKWFLTAILTRGLTAIETDLRFCTPIERSRVQDFSAMKRA